MGSSKKDLDDFPDAVQGEVGHDLYEAQQGLKPRNAKPLRGFGGASVLEIVEDHDRDTYRAVYTVEFDEVLYVLHCFQKKSKRGNETPRQDMELVNLRHRQAREEHEKWQSQESKNQKRS